MMGGKALGACFVLCLLGGGVLGDDRRRLLTADTSCHAFAFLSIMTIGVGSCRGTVKANCTTLDDSRVEKKDIFKTWFEDGLCDSMVQKNASEQLADSVGGIWADAIAHVECTGKGYGCGWVMVDPSGWGASFAQMFVNAAQEALDEVDLPDLDAFCAKDMVYSGKHIGDDAGAAQDIVCKAGESTTEEYKQEYKRITSTDILQAMEIAASAVCGTQSKKSWCSPEHKVPAVKKCKRSTVTRCCSSLSIRRGVCVCGGCSNPLRIDQDSRPSIVWEDSAGKKCKCPKAKPLVQ